MFRIVFGFGFSLSFLVDVKSFRNSFGSSKPLQIIYAIVYRRRTGQVRWECYFNEKKFLLE